MYGLKCHTTKAFVKIDLRALTKPTNDSDKWACIYVFVPLYFRLIINLSYYYLSKIVKYSVSSSTEAL